jgi:hypothetical protein
LADPRNLSDDRLISRIEACLWDSLVAHERSLSIHQTHPFATPPSQFPLRISVEHLVVEQVDTVKRAWGKYWHLAIFHPFSVGPRFR